LHVTVLGNQGAVRIHMSPWQCRILKPQSSAIRDDLNGSNPRMHSFDEVWWSSCSRFMHCAMVPDSSSGHLARRFAECAQTVRVRVGRCGVKNSDHRGFAHRCPYSGCISFGGFMSGQGTARLQDSVTVTFCNEKPRQSGAKSYGGLREGTPTIIPCHIACRLQTT
jgi:hypothetical protein